MTCKRRGAGSGGAPGLNAVPLDPRDEKAAIDEVGQRFADIFGDHLTLESTLLSMVGAATGRTPAQVLDDLVAVDDGGMADRPPAVDGRV